MTGQIVIKSSTTTTTKPPPPSRLPSTTTNRRQRLLTKTLTPSPSTNVGEVAGVTTANCFILSCCCPCLVLELLILSLYKLPRSLGRRIFRNRRRRKLMKSKKVTENGEYYNYGEDDYHDLDYDYDGGGLLRGVDFSVIKVSVDGSTVDLDAKMWEQFCETGFWRSSSQRGS